MKTITYPSGRIVNYDENAPCIVCGEPVISASMGGTAICGACDCGKCRYCGVQIFVFNKSIDGGKSKQQVLKHMEWHKQNTPEIVKKVNDATRRITEEIDNKEAKK